NGQLTYDSEHIDSVGFFQFDGSKTIVAELSGTLDGYKTEEGNGITRIYENAAAGKAYRIRFHINRPDNVHDGDIQLGDGIKVDATIHIKDENYIVDPDEPADEILVDDMRPVEGPVDDPDKDDPNKKDPNEDDPNKDPKPEKNAPTISPTSEGLHLGVCYDVAEGSSVAFTVTSETGITEFKINIDSTTLTKEELEDVGLSADLDLINPGEFEEPLTNLGFPTGDAVKGKTECKFDISGFVPMLMMLGPGEHKFNITVSDANGTSTGKIWLKNEGE
ncbi:MAG: hypothetical protein K2H49_03860, partial [Muribaculaceae bacterium]|nr:hypothetical protein [Muribaculaceae bacterium]